MPRPSPRLLASLCALVVTLTLLPGGRGLSAVARADGVGPAQQQQVEAALKAAMADLDQASAATTAAASRLSAVQGQLTTAQRTLAADRQQLGVAQQAAATATTDAVTAQRLLTVAAGQQAAAAASVTASQGRLRAFAVSAYETGATPSTLVLVAAGDGSADIIDRAGLLDQAAVGQSRQLIDLRAGETTLATATQLVRQRSRAAADRQAAAQAAADRVSGIVAGAAAATRQLGDLTAQQTAALGQARAALAANRSQVAELQAESTRIAALLAARASRGSGAVGVGGLIWPVIGPITSGFGYRRDPVTGQYALHAGVDIGANEGAPIHAAQAGTVIFAGQETGYGNYTCLDHGGGFSTCYAHQSQELVHVGQVVTRGQVIGLVGQTGYATGPHLHFETRVNGTPMDPMHYYPGPPQ